MMPSGFFPSLFVNDDDDVVVDRSSRASQAGEDDEEDTTMARFGHDDYDDVRQYYHRRNHQPTSLGRGRFYYANEQGEDDDSVSSAEDDLYCPSSFDEDEEDCIVKFPLEHLTAEASEERGGEEEEVWRGNTDNDDDCEEVFPRSVTAATEADRRGKNTSTLGGVFHAAGRPRGGAIQNHRQQPIQNNPRYSHSSSSNHTNQNPSQHPNPHLYHHYPASPASSSAYLNTILDGVQTSAAAHRRFIGRRRGSRMAEAEKRAHVLPLSACDELVLAQQQSSDDDSLEVSYHTYIEHLSISPLRVDLEAAVADDDDVENQGNEPEPAAAFVPPGPPEGAMAAADPLLRIGENTKHKKNLSKASVKVLSGSPSRMRRESASGSSDPSPRSRTKSHSSSSTSSSSSSAKRKRKQLQREHYEDVTKCVRWFGHGKFWTVVAVGLAWVGAICSGFARQSTKFATLEHPVTLGNNEPFDAIGLIRLEMCYNETVSDLAGCRTVNLRSDEVDDTMYELARLFGSGSPVFGVFFAFFLTTSVFWETIDLRPIGFGLLLTYFLQSFTMLFFDSDICDRHKCAVGPGCFFCIAASFCWVTSCIATAKMEGYKQRETRRRLRRAKRRAKKALRAAELKAAVEFKRKQSTMTNKTTSTASNSSSGDIYLEEEDPVLTAVDIEAAADQEEARDDGILSC